MKRNLKLTPRKGDILAVILVILMVVCTGVVFLTRTGKEGRAVVQIWQDGELTDQLPLENNTRIEVAGKYHNVIEIRDGKAAIVESDCPGEDCVHSGWIRTAGRSIICLPNRVELRIVGVDSEVDFVVG